MLYRWPRKLRHPSTSCNNVQCMYSVCTVYVQCMYSVCTVYVQCMYSVCTVYVQCMYNRIIEASSSCAILYTVFVQWIPVHVYKILYVQFFTYEKVKKLLQTEVSHSSVRHSIGE